MNKIAFIFILFFVSCNNAKKQKSKVDITKVEVLEKEFYFGRVTLKDTITHTFKIKNLTNTNLKINNLATSCGCATIGEIDSIVGKNEIIDITVQFIPKKEQLGKVSNSVVVEMNTEPSFTIFRLKGEVN